MFYKIGPCKESLKELVAIQILKTMPCNSSLKFEFHDFYGNIASLILFGKVLSIFDNKENCLLWRQMDFRNADKTLSTTSRLIVLDEVGNNAVKLSNRQPGGNPIQKFSLKKQG